MTSPPTSLRSSGRARAARLLLLLALLGAAAVLTSLTEGAGAAPRASLSASVSPEAVDGQQVFLRECAWCHGDTGEGTQFGPSLEESGGAAADFYLRTGRMPLKKAGDKPEPGPPAYSDDTIAALVDYVDEIGSGEPVPELAPGDPIEGRKVFLANCAACHSSSGTGVIVSGGEDAPQLYDTAPDQVAEAVRVGPGPMPRFGTGHLSDKELDDVVSYVQELGPKQVRGGLGLDQFGPIAEGAFALFVVLPLLVLILVLLGKRAKP